MASVLRILTQPNDLVALAGRLENEREVAIDCEADSLHHYFEKLCLVQITFGPAGARDELLVDPLAPGIDLSPLLAVLATKKLLLHGADYDLRLLSLGWGFEAGEVFDTMIAAQYLGEPAIGLAALLEKHFGQLLDKSFQKADWSRRPLPAEMVEYAIRDIRHLPELVQLMTDSLEAKGRLEWHREACRRLARLRPEPRRADPESDWRVKGSRDLPPRGKAILREIWGWREEEARHRDRPPFRVAGNDSLLYLARTAVATGGVDETLDGWRAPLSGRGLRDLREALGRGLALPPSAWPGDPQKSPRPRTTPEQERRLAALRTRRDRIAKELGMEPGIVASRSALEAIAYEGLGGKEELVEVAGLLPWQAELLAGD
jgi:ribonuclease D